MRWASWVPPCCSSASSRSWLNPNESWARRAGPRGVFWVNNGAVGAAQSCFSLCWAMRIESLAHGNEHSGWSVGQSESISHSQLGMLLVCCSHETCQGYCAGALLPTIDSARQCEDLSPVRRSVSQDTGNNVGVNSSAWQTSTKAAKDNFTNLDRCAILKHVQTSPKLCSSLHAALLSANASRRQPATIEAVKFAAALC